MYLGHIVETAAGRELCDSPVHPYARLCSPPFRYRTRLSRRLGKGSFSPEKCPARSTPPGCPFHQRCNLAIPECSQMMPELREIGPNREVACFRV